MRLFAGGDSEEPTVLDPFKEGRQRLLFSSRLGRLASGLLGRRGGAGQKSRLPSRVSVSFSLSQRGAGEESGNLPGGPRLAFLTRVA